MNLREKSRPYPITKEQVWEAFKLVKSNGGSPGVDGVTIKAVANQAQKHLYPVWNRLSSGSYFPPAVKRVDIPKGDGSFRSLGIPTVKDRVAQMVVTKELEVILEREFSDNSFGYRPNKNAHQAIEQARTNCWKYAWVIDMDIKGFFDNIDHGLMIRSLRHYMDRKHIITYVKRWLKAPIELEDGTLVKNDERGTPQGGVISPLLANLFLHVVFDKWMEQEFPDLPFERYADDIIVHVGNEKYARLALRKIRARFEECKLELHPKKTKLVYCNRKGRNKKRKVKHKEFDFLGYTFRTRTVQTKDGKLIKGFSPAISKKSVKKIVKECFRLKFHRWTHMGIHELSKVLAPKIRGWIYYYGRFNKSSLDKVFKILNWRLSKWVFNKYKRFKKRKVLWRARKWMQGIAADFSYIFPHWQHGFTH